MKRKAILLIFVIQPLITFASSGSGEIDNGLTQYRWLVEEHGYELVAPDRKVTSYFVSNGDSNISKQPLVPVNKSSNRVPEPGFVGLIGAALLSLALMSRRKNRKNIQKPG
mgnify:CR=1 FL=1